MAENFPNLLKNIKHAGSSVNCRQEKAKRSTNSHSKNSKASGKEKILKAEKEKRFLPYKRIKLISNKKQWRPADIGKTFSVLKETNQIRILYQRKNVFKMMVK